MAASMEPGYLLSGRYRSEALIGRGSQSGVYRAFDELLQEAISAAGRRRGIRAPAEAPPSAAIVMNDLELRLQSRSAVAGR